MDTEPDQPDQFLFHPFLSYEMMRIVLRESPYAHQAMQHAGPLVPIDVPNSAQRSGRSRYDHSRDLLHLDMERAVHRLELIQPIIDRNRSIHISL